MKHHLTLITLFFISAISFSQEETVQTPEITSVIIEVEGMACQEGCADKISENLNKAAGVNAAEVSYEKKEAIVNFDPTLISLTDVKAIITNTKVKEYVYTIGKTTLKE